MSTKLKLNNKLRESQPTSIQNYTELGMSSPYNKVEEEVSRTSLYRIQKQTITDRTSVNLYVRNGAQIPTKIRNAYQPAFTSLAEGRARKRNSEIDYTIKSPMMKVSRNADPLQAKTEETL